jgi:dihydroflavonol-4-reductase
MLTIDKNKPVLVTGATGYVAGWVIDKLLKEGIVVHAAVRDPKDTAKLSSLNSLSQKYGIPIHYFKADLLEPGSFTEAMQGCEIVIHTASPFTLAIKDPQKELIDPALKGTQNVLNSVNETKSIKRVVLTSSVVAMYGDAIDVQQATNKTIDESYWNSSSSLEHNPYGFSKTLAEKEAWEMQKKSNGWDMVVINPSFVMGPGINPNATSESFTFMKQLIDGSSKAGVPYLSFGLVDVRDVALAHYNAAFNPEASGRHILCAEVLTMLEMAMVLRKAFGKKLKLPKSELPKFLVYLFGPFIGLNRKWIKNNVGWPILLNNQKSKDELGIDYRDMKQTLIEFAEQIMEK